MTSQSSALTTNQPIAHTALAPSPQAQAATMDALKPGSLLLRATHLTKYFGGLAAVNDVSLELRRGEIHAVIGPNGAGKSTLTHLLCGELTPSSGRIALGGLDITGFSAWRVAQQGLGRSFQKTNIFLPFTVFDNVRLAAHFDPKATEQAIALAQLSHRSKVIAANLSHGEQRQLEIALCLASKPQVLILDEPLAGMGSQEAERMIELLRSLKSEHAVLLIEHDMDAVFSLADQLTVMVDGRVIASAAPEVIRADQGVQAAYLGEANE